MKSSKVLQIEQADHEKWCRLIAEWLSQKKHPDRISFQMNGHDLQCKTIVFLVEKLNMLPQVTSLNLSRGNMQDDCAIELAKLRYVTHLNVSHNAVGSVGAIALLENSRFVELDLSNSDFYPDAPGCDQQALQSAVLANHTLKKLSVDRSGLSLTPGGIKEQIEAHFEERKLSLSSNGARFPFGTDLINANVAQKTKPVEVITAEPSNGFVK